MPEITKEAHRERHQELHRALDELVADMIMLTEMRPSETTVLKLMQWSAKQAENPDCIEDK